MSELLDLFWSDSVWLPPNVTWADLTDYMGTEDEVNYRKFSDLWYAVPTAFAILLIRVLLEKLIFRPFGVCLGLKAQPVRPPATNTVLEAEYRKRAGPIPETRMLQLSRELGMGVRSIERWLRKRQMQDRPTKLDKFAETSWRCLYYTFAFIYGMCILWGKKWMWDIKFCWYNFPYHSVEKDVWWYYIFSLSFYCSLCVSQFFDVKRKDFWQMFIHHLTTIWLLGFSWICNLTRIGTLVLAVHDCADIFLESAKLCKYTNYKKACDVLFVFFTVTWIFTRLGVFPVHILYSTTVEAPQIVQMFPAYYIFNMMLSLLLILHVYWTYLIFKIVYQVVMTGGVEADVRSSSSEPETDISSGSEGDVQKNDAGIDRNGVDRRQHAD